MPEKLTPQTATSTKEVKVVEIDLPATQADVDAELERELITFWITQPVDDKNGKVVTPAIDLSTGRTPNGQPIHVFYERGEKGSDARTEADRALARATRQFFN